jgi:CHAT domain-containing protein
MRFSTPHAPRRFRKVLAPVLPLALMALAASAPPPAPASSAPDTGRALRLGDEHAYPYRLAAGDFFDAVADQDGIDLSLELRDPDGRKVLQVDGPNGAWWQEELAAVAERPGVYTLLVRPACSPCEPGRYRLAVDAGHPPGDRDRLRVEAVQLVESANEAFGSRLGRDPDPALREVAVRELALREQALGLWRRAGDRRREAETLHCMGAVLQELGHPQEAAERFHDAASVWSELAVPDRRGYALIHAATEDVTLFRFDEAQGHLEESLRIARAAGSTALGSAVSRFLEDQYLDRDPRAAIGPLHELLDLARQAHDRPFETAVFVNLGYVYDDLAEREEALRCHQEALRLARELKDWGKELNALVNFGSFYQSLGEWEEALAYNRKALDIGREHRSSSGQAVALNNLAVIYEGMGDLPHALDFYGQALERARQARPSDVRNVLINAGNGPAFVYLKQGQPRQALERSLQVLPLAQGNPAFEAVVRQALGQAYRELADFAASRKELDQARQLAHERGDGPREMKILLEKARTERAAGDLDKSMEYLQAGMSLLEEQRRKVLSPELRATFLASRQSFYEFQVDTLMSRGLEAEALRASERARARSLLDLLAMAGTDLREGADPELVKRERRLQAEVEAREKERLDLVGQGASADRLAAARLRIEDAVAREKEAEEELQASHPRYASLAHTEPLSVPEIQGQVLDGGALLLEYALGQEHSYLWALGPDSIHSFVLPGRAGIEKQARHLYELLSEPGERSGRAERERQIARAEDELGRTLLGPVRDRLGDRPLLIVADGALQYLPFAALPDPAAAPGARTPLIAGRPVVTLPSASALALLRRELAGRRTPAKTLAVIADPVFDPQDDRVAGARRPRAPTTRSIPRPVGRRVARPVLASHRRGDAEERSARPDRLARLRFSQIEADQIAALVAPDQRFEATGFDASLATATSGRLSSYRYVHFATHGLIDSHRPEMSSLVLSLVDRQGRPQNGYLRLHDIYRLDLDADLVVLSACQTALGREIRGEGLVGLTRGFMYAGSPRVLATLWSVDDRATADLMKRFYSHLLRGRVSPAEALRRAQVELWKEGRSPYLWAGFTLQGEWK